MARPVLDKSQPKTTERLLEAAELEFARSGFAAARLSDISKAAGINRSSLLYHFESKQNLYQATIQRGFAGLDEMLRDSIELGASFATQLELMAVRFAAYLQQRPTLSRLILRELLAGQGPGWEMVMARVVPMLDSVEEFIYDNHGEVLGQDFPVREALMQVISNQLLKSACVELRESLWGVNQDAWVLPRKLFELGDR